MNRVPGIFTGDNAVALNAGPIPGTHERGFYEEPITRFPVSGEGRRLVHGPVTGLPLDFFQMGECRIIRAKEPEGVNGEMRWHLSLSCIDRHPTWDEIKVARYRLLPLDAAFAMILPPPRFYVNLARQDHVFHLHEIEDPGRPWETL